jgi:hypothetical protein
MERLASRASANGTFPGNDDCSDPLILNAVDDSLLPEEFDMRERWPQCVHPVNNQGSVRNITCSASWAFAATEVLSDRLCIASNGRTNVVLSAQDMVNCEKTNYGCNGGWTRPAWQFLESTGVASESCVKYKGKDEECSNTCDDGSTKQRYRGNVRPIVLCSPYNSVAQIQSALMNQGPVQGALGMAYEGLPVVRHSMKIIGWTTAKADADKGDADARGPTWWKKGDLVWIAVDSFGDTSDIYAVWHLRFHGDTSGIFWIPATHAAVSGYRPVYYPKTFTSVLEDVVIPEMLAAEPAQLIAV